MTFIRSIASLGAFLVCGSIALAQSANPAWIEDLAFEMEREKDCEVAYLMRAEEGELGGKPTYTARVQCVDGRQYDATRVGDDDDFEITECGIQTC